MTQPHPATPQLAADGYRRAAVYFADSDCVEFVKEDTFVIYDRVDEFLTLIYDDSKITPVGFKLKGFKNIFERHLQKQYQLHDEEFITLVSAIEAVCTALGDALFDNPKRTAAYKAAWKIANNDNLKLGGLIAA